jgi:hypothetical protein
LKKARNSNDERALLRVDPKDVAKLEARERARKKPAGKKKRGK